MPDCRPLPAAGAGSAARLGGSEARYLAARTVYAPGDEERLRQQQRAAGADGAADADAAATANGGAAAAKPSREELFGRELAKGRTGLQRSYAWWRSVVSTMRTSAQRQDLLNGALAELDAEMGADVVQVRRPAVLVG